MKRDTDRWFVRLQLAGWSGFFLAMAFSRVGRYALDYMMAVMAILTVLGVVASLALRALLRRAFEISPRMDVLVVATAITGYALAAVWTFTFSLVMAWYDAPRWFGFPAPVPVSRLFDGTVYHAFALIGWGFLYIGIRHSRDLRDTRERLLRAETASATAALEALQARIRPHFLFNTLNAVSTLVIEGRQDEATRMLARLSELLRSAFRHPASSLVTLEEELALADGYLEIEASRLGPRLRVARHIADELRAARIPHLLLQPLIENAVIHGIAARSDGGDLRIGARRDGEMLELTVENRPGVPAAPGRQGTGLASVRERLALLYPGRHSLQLSADPSAGFRVVVRLPYQVGESSALQLGDSPVSPGPA